MHTCRQVRRGRSKWAENVWTSFMEGLTHRRREYFKKTIFAKVRMKDFSNGYTLSQDFIWHKCTLHEPKSGRKRNHLDDKYKDKNAAWIISAAIKSCKSILSFPSAFLCFPSVFFAKNFILAFWLLSCQEVIFSTNWYPTFCFSSYPTLCLS